MPSLPLILTGLMLGAFVLVMGCLAMASRTDRERRAAGEDEDHD